MRSVGRLSWVHLRDREGGDRRLRPSGGAAPQGYRRGGSRASVGPWFWPSAPMTVAIDGRRWPTRPGTPGGRDESNTPWGHRPPLRAGPSRRPGSTLLSGGSSFPTAQRSRGRARGLLRKAQNRPRLSAARDPLRRNCDQGGGPVATGVGDPAPASVPLERPHPVDRTSPVERQGHNRASMIASPPPSGSYLVGNPRALQAHFSLDKVFLSRSFRCG